MGDYQSAIGSVVGALICLALFVCLNVKRLRRRTSEMTYSLYGVFGGMILSLLWLDHLRVDAEGWSVVVAVCGVVMLALLVTAGWILPSRHRAATWVFVLLWAVLANVLPPIILAYLTRLL